MNIVALKYLACPLCGGELTLHNKEQVGSRIKSGELISNCGQKYLINEYIPRFISISNDDQGIDSVESFAFEWNTLNFDNFYQNWIEHIVVRNFTNLDYFKDKVIIDCGAGSAMQSKWMLEAGAKYVISLELSDAVDGIIKQNLAGIENSAIIQCDISNPPIKKGVADIVYCINVIQHTRDPSLTTSNLYKLLGENSELYINYYRVPDNIFGRMKLCYGEFARKYILKYIPNKYLLILIKFVALIIYIPILNKISSFILNCGELTSTSKKINYKQTVLNTYDILGSHHYQQHYTSEGLKNLFSEAGIDYNYIVNYDEVINKHRPGHAFKFIAKR